MKIDQYCQRQRCMHVELEQFWHAFAARGFVSDSWAFLFLLLSNRILSFYHFLTVYGFVLCTNSSCVSAFVVNKDMKGDQRVLGLT